MNFASDNAAGIAPAILDALQRANAGFAPQSERAPVESLSLTWVHGARTHDVRTAVHITARGEIVYPAAALVVLLTPPTASAASRRRKATKHAKVAPSGSGMTVNWRIVPPTAKFCCLTSGNFFEGCCLRSAIRAMAKPDPSQGKTAVNHDFDAAVPQSGSAFPAPDSDSVSAEPTTLYAAFAQLASRVPEQPAVLSTRYAALDHRGLQQVIEQTRRQLRQAGFGSFDSLNPFINKGVAADDIGLIYDTLTTNSLDEPFTVYGLLAEKIEKGPNNSWVRFHLRPQARLARRRL